MHRVERLNLFDRTTDSELMERSKQTLVNQKMRNKMLAWDTHRMRKPFPRQWQLLNI